MVQFNAVQEESVTVQIMDMTGRLVFSQTAESINGINELPLILDGLQAGVYMVTVRTANSVSAPALFVKD